MKHFASCSFGKDSIATILLALEHSEPLDGAIFSEVMFDRSRNISGEIPEHIEWVYSTAIPRLEQMGCPVNVVRAEKDYIDFFRQSLKTGNRKGKIYGFPIAGRCVLNDRCKIPPVHSFYKQFGDESIVQYIGIASDERKRLERLKGNQISLLDKYGYTEKMAMEKCKEYNLVSPLYSMSCRGGGAGSVLMHDGELCRDSARRIPSCGESWRSCQRLPTCAHTDSSMEKPSKRSMQGLTRWTIN